MDKDLYYLAEKYCNNIPEICEMVGIKEDTLRKIISYEIYCEPSDIIYDDIVGFISNYHPLSIIFLNNISKKIHEKFEKLVDRKTSR